MHLAGQEADSPNVAIASAKLRCFLPSTRRNHPGPFFVCVPIFGNCIGMRRHLAARESINPGLGWASIRSGCRLFTATGLDSRVHGNLPDVISMIRVTKTEERSRTVVTIDGQLSGECVTVVETCCSQAESKQKPVYVFLRDVTTVDQAGTMLLRRLAAKGIRLLAHGLYTSYLVQTLASDGAAAQVSSAGTRHQDPDAPRRTL
jgi:hypothetical protein